jgi:hypothetical protein
MLSMLARLFLIRRLFRSRHSHRSHHRSPWGSRPAYGYGRSRSRRRSGFGMFGPVPTYTRRTRGGSFSVGGCCLPIPLALGALASAAALVLRGR